VSEWGDVFGDNVVATAIWDRLLHHSTVATLVLFKGARLAGRIRAGEFKRLRPPEALGEGRRLLSLLEIPTVYDGMHKTNAFPLKGRLSEHRELLLRRMDLAIENLRRGDAQGHEVRRWRNWFTE